MRPKSGSALAGLALSMALVLTPVAAQSIPGSPTDGRSAALLRSVSELGE